MDLSEPTNDKINTLSRYFKTLFTSSDNFHLEDI